MSQSKKFTKTEIREMLHFLSDTMKWANKGGFTFKQVIEEIALCGHDNEQVGFMIKEICLNRSFNINN